VVAVFFLGLFIWAVNTGQFDDTYSPSVRMLFEDKKPASPAGKRTGSHSKSQPYRQAGMKEKKGEDKKK
ncbi:MAG: cbb3-type cytochrome oxidase assembly protein, partial [Cyclobacteriaceae bacterium]|nr:cbb3-type cytochrome oxidase assembly protein [Cyclobacteriaceae bacterium]